MQRYVSKELVHFVGKADRTDEERYNRFKKILLTHKLGEDGWEMYKYSKKLSSNKRFIQNLVCFSDIPLADLGLHMKKYSCFGISFLKSYLVTKGAMPIWYIPKTSKRFLKRFEKTCAEYYDGLCKQVEKILNKIEKDENGPRDEIWRTLGNIEADIFAYMKFFDADKDDSNKENYYMEREWRIWGALDFEDIKNVYRVILPPKYVEQFKKDFPDYCGQISFSEI